MEQKREIKVLSRDRLEKKIGVVVGTRPGIVMFAPIIAELRRTATPFFVVHTGQHYSSNMDSQFFKDLELPSPDFKIQGVAEKKTHGAQTAAMLEGTEKILLEERPAVVLVGGDANTNLAGALAARKLRMIVGHVEAGERSDDWRMPEEHNRRIIDHISDVLFTTGAKGEARLRQEAVQGEIYVTGNPIVDASFQHLDIAERKSDVLDRFGVKAKEYALVTMHREENVDFEDLLRDALLGVSSAGQQVGLPVLFLVHPRTRKRLHEFDLWAWANELPALRLEDAIGYLDFLKLIAHARLVFTDSGGVQQEACIHRIPCVTLRENTEWVETLEQGANRLVGTAAGRIVAGALDALEARTSWDIPFGDGNAAKLIVKIAREKMAQI
ncbi:non-hydrolyzing UDP-N-acetylglucosamine 2-epimerase [Thiovibrio sp. JS02]